MQNTPKRLTILVIRFSSLGDILLTSPTILNLRAQYPEALITFFTKESYRGAVDLIGADEVVALPQGGSVGDFVRALERLDRDRFDIVVDLHGNLRSFFTRQYLSVAQTVVCRKWRATRSMRIPRRLAPFLANDHETPHTIDRYNDTLRGLEHGFSLPARRPIIQTDHLATMPVSDPDCIRAWETLAEWRAVGRTILAVAPFARHATKTPPIDLVRGILESIVSRGNYGVVFLREESSPWNPATLRLDGVPEMSLISADIVDVARTIAQTDTLLCADSGLAHLGAALGIPVGALFGPTHTDLGFAPRGVRDAVFSVAEPCRPCSLHGSSPCYREERFCFTRINPVYVATELMKMARQKREARPALFIDRDGTLIEEKGFLRDPKGVRFEDGAIDALRQTSAAGWGIVIVTNQSGVARGYLSAAEAQRVNDRVVETLREAGIEVDDCLYAPTHPEGIVERYRGESDGRKPGEGMFVRAALRHNLDLRKSWVVGDRRFDYLSAYPLGARGILVRTGYGKTQEATIGPKDTLRPHAVVDSLSAAVQLILAERTQPLYPRPAVSAP